MNLLSVVRSCNRYGGKTMPIVPRTRRKIGVPMRKTTGDSLTVGAARNLVVVTTSVVRLVIKC